MVQIRRQKVVLDACVLFPASLRDTLLWAAKIRLYKLCLTDEIVEEMRRNLVKRRESNETQAQKLVLSINASFERSFVKDYQQLISFMPINEKDRHVLAAAVASQSQIIVTSNLKDFPHPLLIPYSVEAQSPDRFLVDLLSENQQAFQELLSNQAKRLRNPPMTVFQILDKLSLNAPLFADQCRQIFTG